MPWTQATSRTRRRCSGSAAPPRSFLLFENSKARGDFDTKAVSKIDHKRRILTRRRSVKSISRNDGHPKSPPSRPLEVPPAQIAEADLRRRLQRPPMVLRRRGGALEAEKRSSRVQPISGEDFAANFSLTKKEISTSMKFHSAAELGHRQRSSGISPTTSRTS